MTVRIVLVDDQHLVRAGLQRIFAPEDDLVIVAECADGRAAVEAVAIEPPDVVLMDVRMRGMDGIEATRRIREMPSGPPVLVLTTFEDDEILFGAVEAGASGFVLKDASAEDLIRAVRVVAAGGAWLDPAVTPRIMEVYRSTVLPRATEARRADELTAREHEVLELMATGANNTEIAARLNISAATIKTHVGSVFSKLGVRDRAAAIVFAFEHGLAPPRG